MKLNIIICLALRMSVCHQLTIGECKLPEFYFNIFNENGEYDDYYGNYYGNMHWETCTFQDGIIPNYAESKEDFWQQLIDRKVPIKIDDFVFDIQKWNKSTNEWNNISLTSNNESLFRFL